MNDELFKVYSFAKFQPLVRDALALISDLPLFRVFLYYFFSSTAFANGPQLKSFSHD